MLTDDVLFAELELYKQTSDSLPNLLPLDSLTGQPPTPNIEPPDQSWGQPIPPTGKWISDKLPHKHCIYMYIVDREIFAVKKFSPVAWAAKIKRAKIKYTYTRFIMEPSGGEN